MGRMEATVASVGEMVQGQSEAQAQAQQQLEAQYQAMLRQKEQQAQDERDKVRRQGVGWRGLEGLEAEGRPEQWNKLYFHRSSHQHEWVADDGWV